MKWIDLPPVWLAVMIAAAHYAGIYDPLGLHLNMQAVQLAAGVLIGAGLILILMAALEMRKQRTTIIPHLEADKLVQTGIFKRTRNPIYLGDVLILTGLILRFDAMIALPLIPVFVWIIERRFIIPEEDRLRRKFRAEFARYCQKTRRWV